MGESVIMQDRLVRFFDEVRLRSGKGRGAKSTIDVCAVQAADWLAGGDGTSDAPECVCPVIRVYVILINDSLLFDGFRDQLKDFVPRIVGSRGSLELVVRRAGIAAEYAAKFAESGTKHIARLAARSSRSAVRSTECAIRSTEYAVYAAEYAANSIEYAAKIANSEKSTVYAISARSAANDAAESAATCAIRSVESARSADNSAVRVLTLECLNKMIEAK